MIVTVEEGGAVDVRGDHARGRIFLGTLAVPEVAMAPAETKRLIEELCTAYRSVTGRLPFDTSST